MRWLLLLLLGFYFWSGKAQDTVVFKIHSFVGDTIDTYENNYYNLFAQYPPGQFQFAQYKKINSKTFVFITLKDSSVIEVAYTLDKLLNDIKTIESKGVLSYSPLSETTNSAETILYLDNGKVKKKVKKGRRVWLKTYSNVELMNGLVDNGYTYVKMIRNDDEDSNFLTFKVIRKGKPQINIPLSDIKSIVYYSSGQIIVYRLGGALLIPIGLKGIIPFNTGDLALGLPFFLFCEYFGLKWIFVKNLKFHFDNGATFIKEKKEISNHTPSPKRAKAK